MSRRGKMLGFVFAVLVFVLAAAITFTWDGIRLSGREPALLRHGNFRARPNA